MEYRFLILILLLPIEIYAGSFKHTDDLITKMIINQLNDKSYVLTSKSKSSTDCFYVKNEIDITKLKQCKSYLQETYVTADIDAYLSYINKLVSFRIKPVKIPEYSKVLSAEYDEVTSKLYFDIAKSYYKFGDYDEALIFLKKIDDTLDDESVYHALLIYGLIYFEKNKLKKAKYYLSRIDQSSKHYALARYNLALMSMRSSWWGEAEEYLNQAMSSVNHVNPNEEDGRLLDKMYLTLGFSKINRKDFRGAKKSFENITATSVLKNRALVGIAMCEIGLGELNKAAPILKYVMKHAEGDEYLDASVILPQVYHYADNIQLSVEYYKKSISDLEKFRHSKFKNAKKTNVNDLIGYFRENDPWVAYETGRRIQIISALEKNGALFKTHENDIKHVKSKITSELKKHYSLVSKVFSKKIENYIKQIKYSLAVIYDESVASNE